MQAFPNAGRTWQISQNGGCQPRWSLDGSEIYFVSGDTLFAAPVRTAPEFPAVPPRKLFSSRTLSTSGKLPVDDVFGDRKRFILTRPTSASRPVIHVVQNWLRAAGAEK